LGGKPADIDPPVVHRVIQRAMTVPVLRDQRQPASVFTGSSAHSTASLIAASG
jgi:hypothetical protein